MRSRLTRIVSGLALAALVTGCALTDEVLFQSFAGEAPAAKGSTIDQGHILNLGTPAPGLRKGNFRPPKLGAGKASDTEGGRAVALLRLGFMDLLTRIQFHNDELQLLRRSLVVDAKGYSAAVAELGLEAGDAVPANDAQFAARTDDMGRRLNRLYADLLKLNGLASKVTVAAAVAARHLNDSRALMDLPDLTAEDRRQLAALQRTIEATITLTHEFLSETHLDIGSQTQYATEQRTRLAELIDQVASADPEGPVKAGQEPRTRDTGDTGDAAETEAADTGLAAGKFAMPAGRPLVIIRFDRPDVAYGKPLYQAVNEAVTRRADARFEIVGVSPLGTNGLVTTAAMAHALKVKQTLSEMGLPEDRMRLLSAASADAASDEVRVFVRAGDVRVSAARAGGSAAEETPRQLASTEIPAGTETAENAENTDSAARVADRARGGHDPRPLVTIRFDRPRLNFAEPLHGAVQAALDRRPNAHFDLVAIAAGHGDFAAGARAALARADLVMGALTEMGLPPGRVTVEAATSAEPGPDTVLIFVRK